MSPTTRLPCTTSRPPGGEVGVSATCTRIPAVGILLSGKYVYGGNQTTPTGCGMPVQRVSDKAN